jgi:hypothetical protein
MVTKTMVRFTKLEFITIRAEQHTCFPFARTSLLLIVQPAETLLFDAWPHIGGPDSRKCTHFRPSGAYEAALSRRGASQTIQDEKWRPPLWYFRWPESGKVEFLIGGYAAGDELPPG